MPFLAAIPAALGAIGGGSVAAGAISAGSALASGIAGAAQGAGGKQLTPGEQLQLQGASDFRNLANAGGNAQDVAAGAQSQRDLASAYQQYGQTDFSKGPSAEDIASSQGLAGKLFEQQRVGLQQNFLQQNQQYAQQAAIQDRNPLDPVFRNKQAIEQEQQQALLQAQQNTFATQRAQDLPMQRAQQQIDAAQGRAKALGGLATQALANRQALAGLGQNASNVQAQGQGGGLGGAITGFLNTAGAGATAGRQLVGVFNQPPQQQQGGGLGGLSGDQYFMQNANPANRGY